MEDTENRVLVGEVTVDPKLANSQAFMLMVPLAIFVFTPYYLFWKDEFTFQTLREFAKDTQSWTGFGTLIIVLIIIAGIILHELIHAITWALFTRGGFKTIEFGILWREFTPYSHCKEPLAMKHFIFGMIAPGIFLGIVPALLSYFTGNFWLMLFGSFFTAAAAGDIMILRLLKKQNRQDYICDHPTAIGFQVWREGKNHSK